MPITNHCALVEFVHAVHKTHANFLNLFINQPPIPIFARFCKIPCSFTIWGESKFSILDVSQPFCSVCDNGPKFVGGKKKRKKCP